MRGVPRTASYNTQVKDHYPLTNGQPILSPAEERELDMLWVNRLRCLLSIDDIVKEAHTVLTEAGEIDETVRP